MSIFSFYEKFGSHSILKAVDVTDVLYGELLVPFGPFSLRGVSLILPEGLDSISNVLCCRQQ